MLQLFVPQGFPAGYLYCIHHPYNPRDPLQEAPENGVFYGVKFKWKACSPHSENDPDQMV